MTDQPRHDRFSLPNDIPDAAYWDKNGTYEDAVRKRDAARARDAAESRKLVTPAKAGAQGGAAPLSALSALDSDDGRGYTPSHPAGRGWVPQSRKMGIPGEGESWPCMTHNGVIYEFPNGTPFDLIEKVGGGSVFTRELRVRFLDHLAFKGNARAAALSVNVSHETVYRARRQDAAFAALWDAALVHARKYGEQVLASRALDGVEAAIVRNGEIVGYVTRQEPRFMALHLARLDRHVETNAQAVARAGRFDELLAEYAGHETPEPFDAAAVEARAQRPEAASLDVPPTREEYLAYARGLAMDAAEDLEEPGEDSSTEAVAELEQVFMEEAGEEWDGWHEGALARVGAIVEGTEESDLPQAEERQQSPLPLAGGAGGGPVNEPARSNIPTSDTPSPNPSREREGDQASTPTFAIPAKAGTQRKIEPEGQLESSSHRDREFSSRNRVTSVNPPACRTPPSA